MVLGRRCLLAVLCFGGRTVAQEPEQNIVNGTGSPACQCIDPWASMVEPNHSQCHNATVSGVRDCLPANYGAGRCRPWDMDAHMCRHGGGATVTSLISSGLGWCRSAWCYVNASTCERPHRGTQILWHDLPRDVTQNLAYSYETCGNLDEYSASKHHDRLRNQTLRVSYPGDSGSGYTIKTVAPGLGWHGKDGSMVAFMHAIAEQIGFRLELHPVSESSRIQVQERLDSGSSFTQCVHEVALNETDLCIGNFWITNERLSMTSFSGTVYEDIMRLVVRKDTVQGSWMERWTERVQVPFRPFTGYGWVLVLVTVTFASIALHVVEDDSYNFEWKASKSATLDEIVRQGESSHDKRSLLHGDEILWDHPEPSCADRIDKRCGWDERAGSKMLRFISRSLSGVGSSCYYGFMGLLSGDPKHEVESMPGRTLIVGFAFFGVSILASYTASLTSLIIETNTGTRMIANWKDVVADERPVCIRGAMLDNFVRAYPGFDQSRLATFDTRDCAPGETTRGCSSGGTWGPGTIDAADQMLNSVDAGECIAAIIFSDAWDKKFNTGQHCNKVAVDNLFGVANGMPIQHDLQESLSYVIQEAVAAGEYKKFEMAKRRQFLPVRYSCDLDAENGGDGGDGGILGPDHLLGPCILSGLSTCCALFIFYCFGFSQSHAPHMHYGRIYDAEIEKQNLLGKDAVELVYRAEKNMSSPVNLVGDGQQEMFNAALDQLPDKRGLVSLIMRQEGTTEGKQVIKLKAASISFLYNLALSIGPSGNNEAWVDEVHKCLKGEYRNYDENNPKDALVHLLLDRIDGDKDNQVTMQELDAALSTTSNNDSTSKTGMAVADGGGDEIDKKAFVNPLQSE